MSEVNTATAAVRVIANQRPEAGVQGQSPLHHADFATLAKQGPSVGGVVLKEHRFTGLLTLRCDANNAEQLAAAEKILGVPLPTQPLTSNASDTTTVRWMSPDEWLISVPGGDEFEVETAFQASMPGHYALVTVSGGLTLLELSGERVVELLKKATPIDLHASVFPSGKVVSTVFAKSGAVIRRLDSARFELVIRRSFADYLWLWIQDASREYGLVVQA